MCSFWRRRRRQGASEERELARESLYQLRGADVDSAITAAIPAAEPKVKVELIQAVGERNITSAAEILLATAKDANPKVRMESVKVLRIVGGPEQLAALIELLKVSQRQPEARELEKTVAAVANKIGDENQRASAVIAAMENATDADGKKFVYQSSRQDRHEERTCGGSRRDE